jgi:hypothetical protein
MALHKKDFSRKGAKTQREPLKRDSASRLCAFAREIFLVQSQIEILPPEASFYARVHQREPCH